MAQNDAVAPGRLRADFDTPGSYKFTYNHHEGNVFEFSKMLKGFGFLARIVYYMNILLPLKMTDLGRNEI